MIPRSIPKTIVTDIPICEQRSYSGSIAPAGSLVSEVFNLTNASFLNAFQLADPAEDVRIAAGHVLYVFVFYTGVGSALTCNILANAFPGGVLRLLGAPASVAPFAVTISQATVFRTDMLGACWDVQVVLNNTGGVATTSTEFAVAFRTR